MSDKNNFFLRYAINSELISAYTFNDYEFSIMEGQDAFVTKGSAKKYKNDIFEKDYLNGIYLPIDRLKTRKNMTTNNQKLAKDLGGKGVQITYTPTPTPPCEDYEYTFLSHSNRAELKGHLDKLKALDWFKDENKIAMSTFSTYNSSNSWNEYFIVFYPTDRNTKVYSSEVTGIKNTKDNLYQYAYIKCVSRQYERLFYTLWYDKSDNTKPNISFRVNNGYAYLSTSSLCPTGISDFSPSFLDDYGKEIFVYLQCDLNFKNQCGIDLSKPPQPPTPGGGGEQNNGGQTNNQSCSNSGQFGGGGTPLKDIKLFLYANNVTKGTITLSKPQVEVGTFATDWRPNPSDYVHVNNSNFKRINGIAMQHSDDNGKNYLEIQTKDGHVFGIDTWGGTQKLLEQQQAEIDELKKLVQTLSTKINV